ncbi:MAG: YeiH family putative sulfate export transporter [Methylocystaceae bacterium]|nr:YeiH family putative sulfate export transporter [Methylocystaceae bacterium]
MTSSVNNYHGTLKTTYNCFLNLFPGLLLCFLLAMAAKFVSEHYGGPTILYSLLMGMAFNYLSTEGRCVAGIQFASKTVLRVGIALLGARITIEQLMSLGVTPIVIVLLGVSLTIICSIFFGKILKLEKNQSILGGASVGICGASAALAVASVLPQDKESEKNLVFVVISVTALSTVAMILYPLIVAALGFSEIESGIFLGATIHDVAQVVGAGYMISDNVGDIATFTKLLRVAMLVPVVVLISLTITRKKETNLGENPTPFPLFLIGFIVVVSINSLGFLNVAVSAPMIDASRWCLVIAMVGLGMKASFKELAAMGWRPMALMVVNTLFLATLVTVGLYFTSLCSLCG